MKEFRILLLGLLLSSLSYSGSFTATGDAGISKGSGISSVDKISNKYDPLVKKKTVHKYENTSTKNKKDKVVVTKKVTRKPTYANYKDGARL